MASLVSRITLAVRWRRRRAAIDRRLVTLGEQVKALAPKIGTAPVVFFNASTRLRGLSLNAAFGLLASWATRLAGAPVVHFVCDAGMSRCVLGTNRDDPAFPPPCGECVRQSRKIFRGADVRWFHFLPEAELVELLGKRSLADLMNFRYRDVALGELVLPSLRWILRRNTLEDKKETRFLYRNYIYGAWNILQQFGALLDEVKPQAVVLFNGMFYPEAAARLAARQRGIRAITHEVALQPFTAFFTTGEATAYPIEIPDHFQLDVAQEQRLDAYLEQRMQGNFSMAGIRFWPQMHPLGEEFWSKAGRFKQVVPVFTNVIFDTSQGHANTLFENMFDWLDEVQRIIRAHPETYFVIRAHPDEDRPGKQSRESVSGWVEASGIASLPNVLFVSPGEYFSSYELIQKSKFVMVYNSTIGLEATLLGAAVLCAGNARFTQISTVFLPGSVAEFRQMAERFLEDESILVPVEFKSNARRFLYRQLFETSLPLDDFMEEDGIWKGFVALKDFGPELLQPGGHASLDVVVDGILHGGDFLMKSQQAK